MPMVSFVTIDDVDVSRYVMSVDTDFVIGTPDANFCQQCDLVPIHFCEEVAQLKLSSTFIFIGLYFVYPFLRRSGPIETKLSGPASEYFRSPIHFCEEVAPITLCKIAHTARSQAWIGNLCFGEKIGPKLGVLKNNIYCRILIRCRM